MSQLGQTEKNSMRVYVFRFALELGHWSMPSACLRGATSRHPGILAQLSHTPALLETACRLLEQANPSMRFQG